MKCHKTFKVLSQFTGSRWRWSVLANGERIANGYARSQIETKQVTREIKERYLERVIGIKLR